MTNLEFAIAERDDAMVRFNTIDQNTEKGRRAADDLVYWTNKVAFLNSPQRWMDDSNKVEYT